MTKRHLQKLKVCRQLGVPLWFVNNNENKKVKIDKSPGEHGKIHKRNPDNRYEPRYSTQLKEKQKLKKYYGEINENQFYILFQQAMKLKGLPSLNIFTLLERKLDTVVYRMGFAKTIFEARQLVNHGHVFCNGMKVTIPSYKVKNNEVVSLSDLAIKNFIATKEKVITNILIPPYLEVDIPVFRGIFVRNPQIHEIPYSDYFDLKAVIEFYSK